MAIIESGSIPSLPRSPQLQKTMPREDFPAPDRTKPHQNNGGIPCDSCQMDPNALGLFLFSLLLILSEGHAILEALQSKFVPSARSLCSIGKLKPANVASPQVKDLTLSSCSFTVPGLWGNK